MSFPRSEAHATAFALALLAAMPFAVPCAASAAERTPFETVAGWEVERDLPDADGNACLMNRSYTDKDDGDAENAVVFKRYGADVAIVLAYENWTWSADETVKAPFLIGGKVVDAKSVWTGDGTTLKALFPGSIVPALLAAKTIELRIKGAEGDFEIPGFAQGYEALLRCDAAPPAAKVAEAPAKEAPATPAPAEKEPLRMVKAQFVTRPADTFGNIAARGATPFAADEKLQVYLEVEGQTMVPGAGGKRAFTLSLDYEVLNEARRVVAGQKAIIDQEFTLDAQGRPNVFFDVGLTVTGMPPGAYTLALTLHDKRDGRTSDAALPFTVAAAPAEISPVQAKAFFVGLMAQRTVTDCDFPTTAKERAALDAKVAGLKPQDAAVEKELRTEIGKNPPVCPGPSDAEPFRTNIRNFVEMSPEEYVAQMEKRIAEREAADGKKP